jgi:hypothetical protein
MQMPEKGEIPIELVLDKIWYEGERFSLEFRRSSDFSICEKKLCRTNSGKATTKNENREGMGKQGRRNQTSLKKTRTLLLFDIDANHPFECYIHLLRKFNGLTIKHYKYGGSSAK